MSCLGHLVSAQRSHDNSVTLNHFPKETETDHKKTTKNKSDETDKPEVCGQCGYFIDGCDYCKLNASYGVKAETKACKQALSRDLPIEEKRKFFW